MHLHSSHSPTFDNGANKSETISNILMVDLPEQLKNLTNNAENLERVAQYVYMVINLYSNLFFAKILKYLFLVQYRYCEDIYVDSKEMNKQKLLNETKGFTNQALASVSYQM